MTWSLFAVPIQATVLSLPKAMQVTGVSFYSTFVMVNLQSQL